MKKFYLILVLIFTLFRVQTLWACDLLSIEIGSDKNTIENIFGNMDDESIYVSDQPGGTIPTSKSSELEGIGGPVSVHVTEKKAFCADIDFGEVIIKGYVVNNKVAAVEIEVQNGPNNDQSKEGLLNKYVQTSFGQVDTESNQWGGYKFWDIAGKQIYYYKIKSNSGEIIEGVAVTSQQYFEVLMEDDSE